MVLFAWCFSGCAGSPPTDTRAPRTTEVPYPAWPAAGAVHLLDAAGPSDAARTGDPVRLLLDAGHGAVGNGGNTNVRGEREQDVMRRIADGVAAVWTDTSTDTPNDTSTPGNIVVTRTRPDADLADYDRRVELANASDLLISLHSDARAGMAQGWVDPLAGTWWTEGAAGFAVLWSDEGASTLVAARHALARGLARHMADAGFLPYPGSDYPGLYEPDDAVPGVFVDRHAPRQRIRLLRRPPVPSVIVETHEAHDRDEVTRWDEPETWRALASAVQVTVAELR